MLQGDVSLERSKASLKAMLKTIHKTQGGILIEHNAVSGASDSEPKSAPIPSFLEEVLHKYEDVFKEPTGLPPFCGHEHHIVLKDGANLVSVRPYCYPHVQKEEIESLLLVLSLVPSCWLRKKMGCGGFASITGT